MSVPNVDHVIDAVLVALRKATGKEWADGLAPGADTTAPDPDEPYGYVELIAGGGALDGDVGQPSSMVQAVIQLTAVAPTRKGATWLAARGFETMLLMGPNGYSVPIVPAPPTVIISRRHDSTGGVLREGPLFNAPQRYVLTCTAE